MCRGLGLKAICISHQYHIDYSRQRVIVYPFICTLYLSPWESYTICNTFRLIYV